MSARSSFSARSAARRQTNKGQPTTNGRKTHRRQQAAQADKSEGTQARTMHHWDTQRKPEPAGRPHKQQNTENNSTDQSERAPLSRPVRPRTGQTHTTKRKPTPGTTSGWCCRGDARTEQCIDGLNNAIQNRKSAQHDEAEEKHRHGPVNARSSFSARSAASCRLDLGLSAPRAAQMQEHLTKAAIIHKDGRKENTRTRRDGFATHMQKSRSLYQTETREHVTIPKANLGGNTRRNRSMGLHTQNAATNLTAPVAIPCQPATMRKTGR
jgi:hypothetical protein